MGLSEAERRELAEFPAPLRALVEAELAAGNEIAEIGHGFPAPPVGAYAKLARPVSTRPRDAADGLTYSRRPASIYSGWHTDAAGRYFVIDPPLPGDAAEPDMNAIRAANAIAVQPVPPTTPEAPTHQLAEGEYLVTFDGRGETLTYIESERTAHVICTIGGPEPVLCPRTLSGWWYPAERRAETMSDDEKTMVIERVARYARTRLGMGGLRFEGEE